MKIALGTAQIGFNYGINNKKGIPNDRELKMIFALARNKGIKYIDTHSNMEFRVRIGELGDFSFNVVTISQSC